MKTHWFGFWLLVVLALMLAGCPPAETAKKPAEEAAKQEERAKEEAAKEEAAKEEAAKEEERVARVEQPAKEPEAPREPTLDTGKLPPPRQPVEATPDLHDARFRITDRGLELMLQDGVPEDVVNKLRGLRDTNYSNAREFLDAVGGAIGAEALATHQLSILRNSLDVNLAVEPAFPGTRLILTALQPEGVVPTPFGTVFFDFDRSEIKPEFVNTIRKNASKLRENPDMKVVIEGHCDERGTTEYNLALGERRANAVKEALIAHGVAPEQLKTVSFGEERPADPGHDEAAWAKNRRGMVVPAQ